MKTKLDSYSKSEDFSRILYALAHAKGGLNTLPKTFEDPIVWNRLKSLQEIYNRIDQREQEANEVYNQMLSTFTHFLDKSD